MPTPRRADQLRPTTIEPFPSNAAACVMITQGQTRVICSASLSEDVPPFLIDRETGIARSGWVTAEYNMMPGSTPDRKKRGVDSRGTEIKRLIGRCIRAAIDLDKMPGVSITLDCDVATADGGTRTASITGAFVALALAVRAAKEKGLIEQDPIIGPVAAISVGIIDGKPHLDLDYPLDVRAGVDMNIAMNHKREYVEVQGTAEGATFDRTELDTLLSLADKGIRKLIRLQRDALR